MLPTNTDVEIAVKSKVPSDADAVVAFITQDAKDAGVNVLADEEHRAIERLISAKVVRGKGKEIAFDLIDGGGRGKHRRVYAVGLGAGDKVTAEIIRQSAGVLAKALRKHRMRRVAIKLPAIETITPAAAADAIATGILLARFKFGEYKGTANKKKNDDADETPLQVT